MNEEKILSLMKNLKCSREEAISVIKEDAKIDKMKSMKELNADLTPEQIKASKEARKTGTKKTTTYKFDTTKRQKKENPTKKNIVETLKNAVGSLGADITVTNEERELVFVLDGVKYKLTLACPRS